MDFVIVTGLSGAGKSRAINALEDIGFYCVDNIPPKLIIKIAEFCIQSKGQIDKVAVVVDARGGALFHDLFDSMDELKKNDIAFEVLFLDCNDDVLIRRFKETRRKHPLLDTVKGEIEQAILVERELLKPIRAMATYTIDTSHLSAAQLKEQIVNIFLGNISGSILVNSVSFGFKYGLPLEADLVFDVRCLPNPFYIDNLRHKTGLDQEVRDYVMEFEQSQLLKDKLLDLIDFLLPQYVHEGKSQLVVAVGCTGGKHRSVTFAEIIAQHLSENGVRVNINHRDIQK